MRAFIERTKLPFLASPMGKGVIDDNHPLSVGAARSHALKEADVIFLMGARLNWIMHYGLPPRFNKDVRSSSSTSRRRRSARTCRPRWPLVGDGKAVVGQLNKALQNRQWFYRRGHDWHKAIAQKSAAERQGRSSR